MEKKLLLVVQGWLYVEEQFRGPAAPVAPQFVNVNGELKAYSGGGPTLQKVAHALFAAGRHRSGSSWPPYKV